MAENKYFQFGLTKNFDCNYLPNQQERLIVVTNESDLNNENYQRLLMAGFRRSGDQVYRPHCIACKACESLRVPVKRFKPSRSQKRLLNSNRHLTIKVATISGTAYYPLYEKYINTIHQDGSMYPATKEQYQGFLFSTKLSQFFIEIYDQSKLIAVAVCDHLPDALSALYTFYDPDYHRLSLGKFAILMQLELAEQLGKEFVYLGYQIDDCAKMNYKKAFYPHQRLQNEQWVEFHK
ncbi:arginyltransferase [Thalassotalea aquiviva]|uniref:arginyltransferase n=1 Tax=Thalassotalea aquiviva TaxID=3242415 RepID=UPI00352BAEA5